MNSDAARTTKLIIMKMIFLFYYSFFESVDGLFKIVLQAEEPPETQEMERLAKISTGGGTC